MIRAAVARLRQERGFASVEPGPKRAILNRSEAPVTALLIGVDPSGNYVPMSWG